MFKDELDAAKRVNQLCEEQGIPLQNPEISAIPNEQYQVTKNYFCLMALWEKIFIFSNFSKIFFSFKLSFLHF